MFKLRRMLILFLVLTLTVITLSGCSSRKLPDGIENEKYFKELSSLYGSIMRSLRDSNYYEEEINKSLDKLNEYLNDNKLNEFESLIVKTFNDNVDNIKYDLTHDKKIIKSSTMAEFEWIIEMMSEHFKK